jgi:hypothetical protein
MMVPRPVRGSDGMKNANKKAGVVKHPMLVLHLGG